MRRYRLMNAVTGDFKTVNAMTVQQACENAGWSPNLCYVSEITDKDRLIAEGVIKY